MNNIELEFEKINYRFPLVLVKGTNGKSFLFGEGSDAQEKLIWGNGLRQASSVGRKAKATLPDFALSIIKTMRNVFSLLTLLVISNSCNKDHQGRGGAGVEIYLLKTVQLVTNKCQVDASHSTTEETPLVANQNIVAYSKRDYEFKLDDEGIQKIKTLIDRTPFALTVNRQVIYYGFFKPGISSSSCDHSITMDINWSSENKIRMRLGYPGQLQGVTIDDKRNNPLLLATLARQNKLR